MQVVQPVLFVHADPEVRLDQTKEKALCDVKPKKNNGWLTILKEKEGTGKWGNRKLAGGLTFGTDKPHSPRIANSIQQWHTEVPRVSE